MKQMEKTLKAMANHRRLAIAKFLKDNGASSVGEIAREIKLSFKSTSRHLGLLSAADIVDKEQKGLTVFYFLSKDQKPVIKSLFSHL
ncbi:MAG: metalloregulator ArsR/SmtB family transcription factor [Patescibacteria group bacterium]